MSNGTGYEPKFTAKQLEWIRDWIKNKSVRYEYDYGDNRHQLVVDFPVLPKPIEQLSLGNEPTVEEVGYDDNELDGVVFSKDQMSVLMRALRRQKALCRDKVFTGGDVYDLQCGLIMNADFPPLPTCIDERPYQTPEDYFNLAYPSNNKKFKLSDISYPHDIIKWKKDIENGRSVYAAMDIQARVSRFIYEHPVADGGGSDTVALSGEPTDAAEEAKLFVKEIRNIKSMIQFVVDENKPFKFPEVTEEALKDIHKKYKDGGKVEVMSYLRWLFESSIYSKGVSNIWK
jgi:hypothetical protein